MSAKPTPGPLIVRAGANGDVGIIATSEAPPGLPNIGGALVAECFADIRRYGEGARAEALANATLFSASHEMLSVLRVLVPLLDAALAETGFPSRLREATANARAAIANATGEKTMK
jgi:hypothetical protein